jgi:hypothetical protein
MPRYYFHLKSPSRPVRDKTGVELSGLEAAHWHAMRLAYRLREHAAETGEDWVIAVADEFGAAPLVVLPSAVPMLREPTSPPRFETNERLEEFRHTGVSRYPAREAQGKETGSRLSPG